MVMVQMKLLRFFKPAGLAVWISLFYFFLSVAYQKR
jgi:hypothetical protein